ncbi:hypothetical protein SDRG_11105 [Saprolegnia diclina VS20]|uniref:Protein kinase domain-containing protein n=1 Tax=Saprolegnia diclina (strain VS20) TaxID=1156394 RepID=T0Q013_SAPDV|nr:hypothetical protein SDRG_11105 [Saprolegnia diclina VS20]EQC31179.1 hypothetical protein SDRG_11105 [Saprolegnia diclina VS20]|eukprot:XP_008615352.1 hypothetical protein SDRG_11105 [Saprolegnia diclina VS20]
MSVETGDALVVAASKGSLDDVRRLLRAGSNVNGVHGGTTPLWAAAAKGHLSVVQLLLEASADPFCANVDHELPRDVAKQHGHTAVVAQLAATTTALVRLFEAIVNDEVATVQQRLREKVPLNVRYRSLYMNLPLCKHETDKYVLTEDDGDAEPADGVTVLHIVAAKGYEAMLRMLLAEATIDIHQADNYDRTPLHEAASAGTTTIATKLLLAGARVDALNRFGETPQHFAATAGHEETLRFLLTAGADVNARSKDGTSLLHGAASNGHASIIHVLLAHGAVINSRTCDDETPLMKAARFGHVDAANALLGAGAVTTDRNRYDHTPLHIAVFQGHCDMVTLLLAAGAAANSTDWELDSPLHDAARAGNTEVISKLLAAGATVNAVNQNGMTPLYLAASDGRADAIPLFLAAGADVDSTIPHCKYRTTPLHLAAEKGRVDAVHALLVGGADITACTRGCQTPLHFAASEGHTDVVEAIVVAGAVVDATDNNQATPLHGAAVNGHDGVVAVLVAAGASINACDNSGYSALFLAAEAGHVDVVQLLLNAKADARLATKANATPRSAAKMQGHTAVVELLDSVLHPNGHVSLQDERLCKKLSDAVTCNDRERVQALLACGADPNTLFEQSLLETEPGVGISFLLGKSKTHINDGSSLLHVAAVQGFGSVLDDLLATPTIDVDARDSTGATALLVAASHGHAAIVQTLLRANADFNLASLTHETPLHSAVRREHRDVVEALLDAGIFLGAEDQDNKTPWMLCQEVDNEAITELFRTKTDVSACEEPASTASSEELVQIVRGGDVAQLQALLQGDVNPNVTTTDTGDSLLHVAAQGKQGAILNVLLKTKRINFDVRNHNMETALLVAIKQRDVCFAQKLHRVMLPATQYVSANTIVVNRDEALGGGQASIVYMGEFNGDAVAVKTALFPSQAPGLICEIEALQRCDSPYLTRLLAVADHDTACPKLVFDYMGVGNLRMYLDKKRDAG